MSLCVTGILCLSLTDGEEKCLHKSAYAGLKPYQRIGALCWTSILWVYYGYIAGLLWAYYGVLWVCCGPIVGQFADLRLCTHTDYTTAYWETTRAEAYALEQGRFLPYTLQTIQDRDRQTQ